MTMDDLRKSADQMRQDWEHRAQENSCYYVKSDQVHWDKTTYLESGRADVDALVLRPLTMRGMDLSKKSILEIGCGNGRMTRWLSEAFDLVYAIDISEKMIAEGRQVLREHQNVKLFQGNGVDLQPLEDNAVDCCFSYIVFQHLPRWAVIRSYIAEIARVLKSGGIARIQFNSYPKTLVDRYPKKYFLYSLQKFGFRSEALEFQGYFDTWVGTYVPKWLMRKWVLSAGFSQVRIEHYGGTDTWVEAIKP